MLGPVRTLGEHAERDAVANDLEYILLDIEVLDHVPEAVTTADHRKDLEESEQLGKDRILEEIRPGTEHGRSLACAQDQHRVHQSIAVVGGKDDGSILGDIFQAGDLDLTVGKPGTQVSVETYHAVSAAIAMDARAPSLLGFFHIVGHY